MLAHLMCFANGTMIRQRAFTGVSTKAEARKSATMCSGELSVGIRHGTELSVGSDGQLDLYGHAFLFLHSPSSISLPLRNFLFLCTCTYTTSPPFTIDLQVFPIFQYLFAVTPSTYTHTSHSNESQWFRNLHGPAEIRLWWYRKGVMPHAAMTGMAQHGGRRHTPAIHVRPGHEY